MASNPAGVVAGSVCVCRDEGGGADVAPLVEGENVDVKPTGTSIVTMYQNGQALKFLNVCRGV